MRTLLIYSKVTFKASPAHLTVLMILCTEYKWKSLDFQPRLCLESSRFLRKTFLFPIYLLLYGTHHLGIKLLSLFK